MVWRHVENSDVAGGIIRRGINGVTGENGIRSARRFCRRRLREDLARAAHSRIVVAWLCAIDVDYYNMYGVDAAYRYFPACGIALNRRHARVACCRLRV